MTFLSDLIPNNNKPWFDAHKSEFRSVQSIFLDLSQEILDGMAALDSDLEGLTIKQCTYRFYRDIRFSKDKSPYKQHFGLYMCKGGKCSGRSGYYFHLEPTGANYIGSSLLCTGAYCPEPFVVKSIREEFMLNGEEFVSNINRAKHFSLSWEDSLKTVPKGFPKDSPFVDYFKLKSTTLQKNIDEKYIFGKDLVKRTLDLFAETIPFNRQLNKAIDFAYEEYTK